MSKINWTSPYLAYKSFGIHAIINYNFAFAAKVKELRSRVNVVSQSTIYSNKY